MPDLVVVLPDGPVRGEEAGAGGVQHGLAQPGVPVVIGGHDVVGAILDVDAVWAPESVVEGVSAAVASAANIGFTNEKPAGFSGDDAGRMVQDLLAGTYTPETFAEAYEKAWNEGF